MDHLTLGAINKNTGKYVNPIIANKKDKYVCPCCDKDVIPKQGKIKRHHFAHKKSDNPCNYYNHPGETQIHKDAKMMLKMVIENKTPISFIRPCKSCNKLEECEIPEVDENSTIEIEYRFDYNGSNKSADVAYIQDGEIMCIFEVCNTNPTCEENRSNDIDWFEFDAISFINMVNENNSSSLNLKIPCIRDRTCDDCRNDIQYNSFIEDINIDGLTTYARNILKQKYPTRDDRYEYEYDIESLEYYHGRLYHHADMDNEINHNKEIIKVFEKYFYNNKVVLHMHKGGGIVYIMSKSVYDKYDYWNCSGINGYRRLPYKLCCDMDGGLTTSEIIARILFICAIAHLPETSNWLDDDCQYDFYDLDKFDKRLRPKYYHPDNYLSMNYILKNHIYKEYIPSSHSISIDKDKFVFLKVQYEKRNYIKKLGGEWNIRGYCWQVKKKIYQENIEKINEIAQPIIWIDRIEPDHKSEPEPEIKLSKKKQWLFGKWYLVDENNILYDTSMPDTIIGKWDRSGIQHKIIDYKLVERNE